jgi:hypothetical protein
MNLLSRTGSDRVRAGELVRKAFEILLSAPDGIHDRLVLAQIERSFPLTEAERAPGCGRDALKPFEATVYRGIVAPLKTGWLVVSKGKWQVTEAGRRAYAQFPEPERFLLEAGRRSIRGWVSVHFPRLYFSLGRAREQLLLEYRLVRRVGLRRLMPRLAGSKPSWQDVLPMQLPQRFVIPEVRFGTLPELLEYFEQWRVPYREGGHTIYLPPASVQRTLFRGMMGHYPHDAGLKIVKNGGSIDSHGYMIDTGRHVSRIQKRITHSRRHLGLVANLLFSKGVGPRLYDLVELQCGEHLWTAYVTQHVNGRVPTVPECEAGVKKIRELESTRVIRITIPDGYNDAEFCCPGCGGNALTDSAGRFQYIDFQNFLLVGYEAYLEGIALRAVEDSHFGDRSLLRGGRYLYQTVPGVRMPGRRDPEQRMAVLQQLMEAAGVSVEGRLVLDIGCNIGMMMALYLKWGARWCHGWDREAIPAHATELLLALGCTRFSVTSRYLSGDEELEADLPGFVKPLVEGCVVSYLAVRGHLGWVSSLEQIPWSFLLYEGHEGETPAEVEVHLQELAVRIPFRVAGLSGYQDGDSAERPLAILLRSPHPAPPLVRAQETSGSHVDPS